MEKTVRIALYTRVSTSEQATEGTSLEHQKEQLETYCKAQGWEVFNTYTDPGCTGKNGDRPALKRLMVDAKSSLFTKVVVLKLDRLSRNLRLLLELEEKFKEEDVTLLSIKENIDTTTAIGRTVFQVLGLVGQWEREAIIERTRSGRIQRYKEGCWAGGKPAYGYAYDKTTKKLIINKKEARVVRRIFEQYRDGKSLSGIANMLNEDGIKARSANGKGWRPTAIRNILVNPAYKGQLIVNRHMHISDIAKVDTSKAIKIEVPSIVSESLWQLAQQHLINNRRVRPVRKEKWLLQGLITCGLCGFSFKAEKMRKNRYHSCRGNLKISHLDGSPKCTSPRLRADWLEDQVWQRVLTVVNDPNKLEGFIIEAIESLKNREEELQERLIPVDEQLSHISEQKARLADEWVTENLNPVKYKEYQRALDKEEARLKVIRSSIDPAQLEELESTRSMLNFWDRQLKSMAWNIENEDGSMVQTVEAPHKMALQIIGSENTGLSQLMSFPATRRELLDKLQVHVVVFNDRIEINSVFPLPPIDCQKYTSIYQGEGDKGDRVT